MDTDVLSYLTVSVAGHVDAGKSTTVGVLTKYVNVVNGTVKKSDDIDYLDNGNGKMRSTILNFKHEQDSGRTSSISTRELKCSKNIISLVDLCGHTKYLKTTLTGITGYFPDYGILVISGNKGLSETAREHFHTYLAYGLPFIILITKVDIVPLDIYNKLLVTVTKSLARYNRKGIVVNRYSGNIDCNSDDKKESVDMVVNFLKNNINNIPIISISNTNGYYINFMKTVLDNLIPYNDMWNDDINSTFYIDGRYSVKGVGIVVSGILKGKSVHVGDILKLGPIGNHFVDVKVSSIHIRNKEKSEVLFSRQRGCLAIKFINSLKKCTKRDIRKGSVIISSNSVNESRNIVYNFKCDLAMFSSYNSCINMSNGYMPIIYVNGVRQAAILTLDEAVAIANDDDSDKITSLKSGVKYSNVKFRFAYRPEFIEIGSKIIFVDNVTKGRGTIVSLN